jgi:SAM-dependent methyltransferase
VLFLQDEYDNTDAVHAWIKVLGIGCVYTCVPQGSLQQVYPAEKFPGVDFRQTLTGFVPGSLPDVACLPLSERPLVIGYRGRELHPRYGDLAREKWLIGERMREICAQRRIKHDIESSEDRRIYGRKWYEFLASCRATLGTESGSNVLDADGGLRGRIDAARAAEPDLSYEEIHARFIGERDGAIRMNQISPRIFEAAAVRTALILFEGAYSGLVTPWEHYLPLRKDFSNVDDVLARLDELPALEAMTARAYAHLIASGNFGYPAFVRGLDDYLESRVKPSGNAPIGMESIVPPGPEETPFMQAVPETATDVPFKVEWLVPAARVSSPEEEALERVRTFDRANAEFWDELCGTQMARELGIVDHSAASLERFDRSYMSFYPYLLTRVPVDTMKGKTVLEIGLGYGTLGQRIAEAGARYFGLDVARIPVRMMEHRLRMRGLQGAAVQGSMLHCPFGTRSIDVVVSIGCFHHTGDIERCIEETYRVLRPGGEAYVMVYNQFSLRQWLTWPRTTLRALVRERVYGRSAPSHESQRKAYDASPDGQAAPETAFVSRARLRSKFRQFSRVFIHSENSDPLSCRGREILSRDTMLRLGWLWGLDLYIAARK